MRGSLAALSFLPALGLGGCGTEVLRVGSLDDPDYALTWFRMVEVGPDGRIYTLHPMEQVVRAFSPDGTLEFVIGGRGEGPGEFLRPFQMGRIADTLWVKDNANNRFTLFSLDGELIGSVLVPLNAQVDDPDARRALPETLLPGGRIHAALLAPTHKMVDGTITHDVRVLMDRDGLVTDTIARIPLGEGTWEITDPDNPRAARLYAGQPLADFRARLRGGRFLGGRPDSRQRGHGIRLRGGEDHLRGGHGLPARIPGESRASLGRRDR